MNIDTLYQKYHVQKLLARFREHIGPNSSMMYRHSKKGVNLDYARPNMNLRSNNKVKDRQRWFSPN